MSQEAGALTTIYWWMGCHRYTEKEHPQQVLTLTQMSPPPYAHRHHQPQVPPDGTQAHLGNAWSGPTVPTNNPTRRHNQHVFTTAACPCFHAEYHACQCRGNSLSPSDTTTTTDGLATQSSRQIMCASTAACVTHYGAHFLNPETRA